MATLGLSKLISDIQAKYSSITDVYFDNVTLLLNYDNTFTDKSSYNQTITTSGNAAISTTQKKFGPSSGFFPNTPGSDLEYIYTPISSNNSLGSGDFTLETWVYLIDKDDNYPRLIQGSESLDNWNSTSSWTLVPHHLDNGDVPGFAAVNLNGNAYVVEATTSLSLNVWYHLAVTREGDTFRIFVNGSLEGTSVFSGSIDALPILYQIGGIDFTNSENTNGYIDDTRITKGVARYTESFTPPSLPLPLSRGSEALINLYNLTTKVSSGYKVNQLPPAASKQFGSILRVDDTYYATNGSDWNTISLADSDYVNYIFQGQTAGHFVSSASQYDVLPFANDTPAAGTVPSPFPSGGTKANAGLSDKAGNVGYIAKSAPNPFAKVNYASNTATLVSPFTITSPTNVNSNNNVSDVNGGAGYLARIQGNVSTNTNYTIDKVPFADVGTATINVGTLTFPAPFGYGSGACPSSTDGFIFGALAPGGPVTFDEVHKFPFASVTTLASTFLLNAGVGRNVGTASQEAGYSIYGRGPGPSAVAQNNSYKFPFATDVSSTVSTPLGGRLSAASATSETAAYIYGGTTQEFPTVILANTAQKIPYASEASSTDLGALASPVSSPTGTRWQGVQG